MESLTAFDISRRLTQALLLQVEEGCSSPWVTAALKPAAVLVPLLRILDEWQILFTRRTDAVADHKGQVSFPGGRADPGDKSPEFTALREAEEEIGLKPTDVHVLGRLRELPTITNYCVTPIIGVIPWPYFLHPATIEVSRVFQIPLTWLADKANHETRTRILPGTTTPIPVIYFKPYDGELLWGVSAQITVNFLTVLGLYSINQRI
jgi:8-oxo-dGTP pyrophosphatase MutT (NUDIX family)